jgi:ATP-binding cassette subfamily F protein 3
MAAAAKKERRDKMLQCVRAAVPTALDGTIEDYLVDVIEATAEADLTDAYETVGPILQDACPKAFAADEKIHALCNDLMSVKFGKPIGQKNATDAPTLAPGGGRKDGKLLSAPVNLGEMLKDQGAVNNAFEFKEKRAATLANQEELAKQIQRKERRNAKREADAALAAAAARAKENAVKNKMLKRRIPKDKTHLSRDVKVENFDISILGNKLLENATLSLAYGRRYGLVGRNGIGKSTLLRAVADREIKVPDHLAILHVEQEAEGDDTSCLEYVLQADVERTNLLAEEKQILTTRALAEKDGLPVDEKMDKRLMQIHAKLVEIEGDKAEKKAAEILAGLGFGPEAQRKMTKEFSGGWRMRIALARALFCEPDLLLLDEPTNMLDLRTCLWLEAYLTRWDACLLVVSHDRDFLNAVVTDIIHQFSMTLTPYRGNYDAFEKVRAERLKNQTRAIESQASQTKHIQAFIDRFRYNAKRASLVQSRLKMLAKMEVIPDIVEDPTIMFGFPDPEPLSPPVIQFNDVNFGYAGSKELFRKLNFGLDMDSRVAVVGANGMGKSTMLKLLNGEIQPTGGYLFKHHKLRLAKFSQHFVDQLDLNLSALEFYRTNFPGKDDQAYRSHLGSFGISGNLALQSMRTLSGGQKSRVAFSLLGWKRPHFILLDEPTNHLDIETVDVLAQALNRFQGGIMVVTHDQRLITLVCNEMWICENGTIEVFEGDFEQYRKKLGDEVALSQLA